MRTPAAPADRHRARWASAMTVSSEASVASASFIKAGGDLTGRDGDALRMPHFGQNSSAAAAGFATRCSADL